MLVNQLAVLRRDLDMLHEAFCKFQNGDRTGKGILGGGVYALMKDTPCIQMRRLVSKPAMSIPNETEKKAKN